MLGIDTGKDTMVAALVNPTTRDLVWRKRLDRTVEGMRTLLKETPENVPLVIEPTGRYSHFVVQQALAHGRTVYLAPTRQAKAFCESLSPRVKSDPKDSLALALFGLSRPLPLYQLKPPMAEHLDQLLSARKKLVRFRTSLKLQSSELAHASQYLEPVIAGITQQIAQIDKQIAAQAKQGPIAEHIKRLRKVHGVGPVTAAALASRLSTRTFAGFAQFVAYVGLDVGYRQSGKSEGRRRLTKQGDAELRRLLYLGAQATIRMKDSPFKDIYQRERAKGLPSTAAICVVARKIAKICWLITQEKLDFDPNLVGPRAKAKEEGAS